MAENVLWKECRWALITCFAVNVSERRYRLGISQEGGRERQVLPPRAPRGTRPGIEGSEWGTEQRNRSLLRWAQTENTQVWVSVGTVAVPGTDSKQRADKKFICCHLIFLLKVNPKIFSQHCFSFMISFFLVLVDTSICLHDVVEHQSSIVPKRRKKIAHSAEVHHFLPFSVF